MEPRTKKEPVLPMPIKSGDQLINEIEQEIKEINDIVVENKSTAVVPHELTGPERLGEEIANAMVASATDALTEAQNHLEQTKLRAEKIREDIRAWAALHNDIMHRFRELGKETLDSHDRYNQTRKS